jgi:hypothetical protein
MRISREKVEELMQKAWETGYLSGEIDGERRARTNEEVKTQSLTMSLDHIATVLDNYESKGKK